MPVIPQAPLEVDPGAHGTEVSNMGGSTYELLKGRTGGFVSPHVSGRANGDDTSRYGKGLAFDFSEQGRGRQIQPYGPDNPHPNITEPAQPIPIEGKILKPVLAETLPRMEAAPAPAPTPRMTGAAAAAIPQTVGAAIQQGDLAENTKLMFLTDIGPFECKCLSLSVSEDMWITAIGRSIPKIPAGKTFNIEIDGKQYACYSPGINVEIRVVSHVTRISHFLIVSDEK